MSVEVTPLVRAEEHEPADVLGEDTVILYFGNDWFAENRTSSHQLARQLARRHTVYYIECPGWRAPKGSGRDLKKIVVKLWRFLRGTRTVDDRLKLRTLFQIPFHRFGLVRWLNLLIVKATLHWLMWREGIRRPITWFHIPHVPYLVGSLGEKLCVYYCIDDYSAYPGVNSTVVRSMDDETTRRADVVFIASDTLLKAKKELNAHTYVSPHGVEYEHFARAQDPRLTIPTDVAQLRGPVIGFFGLIEKFVDLDLIDWLAEQRPEWNFVILGRVAVPDETLPQRSNVHFLGKRPYEELPAYGKRFDAAIIPYRSGAWSFHANPIKLREYLAMGKPVVSVETPQILKFADVVAIARTREEFLEKLDEAVAGPQSGDAIRRRMNRVRDWSWDRRADEVLGTIRDRLEALEAVGAVEQVTGP
jgi:glycosyltransferase involved in cell wall biosynthesis